MAINLYKHNEEAYNSALEMLNTKGKAAVIHPTGTGKSFIGFKLCENFPGKTVCWLSPSDYIFKTQLENLKKASSGYEPQNISFFTYAKLMNMSGEEIAEIRPDYIILDEFHRCGAEVWGKGVQNLLNAYPHTPILGLSATAIRYLDNRRDMSDELFAGNVASVMTLGEAIVRGILNSPKYVTALYSYQQDLERYERRVRNAQSKIVRKESEKYLEALRRAIEKSEGLDEIFQKHITDRSGKYIVFCANKEHMDEMISNVSKWFSGIDENPEIYSAYSDNPETSTAFADFKKSDSEHLKLLFCIDMLNEGIHIEGISGVIMFRPTVSPIIYKQQIGRALCAGTEKSTVILDIVDNISGLYSIGAIEEEMKEAVDYYNYRGESSYIVNDKFRIIDEVEDCKKLFDELERTLSASWDFMYGEAEKYYRENGNLLPPQTFVTEDGYKLGQWIISQRTNRSKNDPSLTEERIAKLDRIGMQWQGLKDRLWEEKYALAQEYYKKNGNLNVTKSEDSALSSWVIKQRQKYRLNELTSEQFDRLSKIGIVWEFEDTWNVKYQAAKRFYYENGHLDIQADYVTKDGIQLGRWYRSVKNSYRLGRLSEEKQRQLEEIGMKWDSVNDRTWMLFFELAKEYYQRHGNLNINAKYETEDGLKLGTWISSQRYSYSNGNLSDERIALLESIGMSWQRDISRWEEGFLHAGVYFENNASLNPSADYVSDDGFPLGRWVTVQRRKYQAGTLTQSRISQLEKLTIDWNPSEALWQEGYQNALEYCKAYGNLYVPAAFVTESGYKLGAWLNNQRTKYKTGKLSKEHTEILEKIGMTWNLQEAKWYEGYSYAQAYFKQHKNLNVTQDYVTEDGFCLGNWLSTQRKNYKTHKLSNEKAKLLDSLHMVWNPLDDIWENGFSHAVRYAETADINAVKPSYCSPDGYKLGEWLRGQKRQYPKGKLGAERQARLENIGMYFQ